MAKFNEMKAQVLAVSVDSPFAQKAFAEQNKLNFTLLSDFRREAVRTFGIEDPNFINGLLPGVAKRSVFDPKGPHRLARSEEHTSVLQSRGHLVCRLLLEKKK